MSKSQIEDVASYEGTENGVDEIEEDGGLAAIVVEAEGGDEEEAEEESEEITGYMLQQWHRRAMRKYYVGITVLKVGHTGRLIRRKLTIGTKPEYVELTNSLVSDICWHIGDIIRIESGTSNSQYFDRLRTDKPSLELDESRCLTIGVKDETISILFRNISDRRDCQFLLRIQRQAIKTRWKAIADIYKEQRESAGIPALDGDEYVH